MVDWVAITVVVVGLGVAVELLGKVGDPAGDLLLRLLEALLDVLTDLGQIVYAVSELYLGHETSCIPSKKLCSRSGSPGLPPGCCLRC